MRRTFLTLALGVALLLPAATHSQAPAQNTVEILQAMKKANAELIEKQQKSLETLDKIEELAKQLKIFGKRA